MEKKKTWLKLYGLHIVFSKLLEIVCGCQILLLKKIVLLISLEWD